MASQSKVTRDVASVLSQKGRIGGHNPMGSLKGLVETRSQSDHDRVERAVEQLEEEGKACVKRDDMGKIMEIIRVDPKPKRYADRTERSPQQKREDMFAKGVPAYLPDDKCTPVVTTRINGVPPTSSEATTPQSSPTLAYVEDAPYHETLTTCLMALRQMADEQGIGTEVSVRSVMMLIDNMTASRASRALDHLRGMGLYATQMTGFQASTYTVDTELEAVTAEMVTEYRRSRKAASDADNGQPTDSTAQAVSESIEVELANVIEALESQVRTLQDAVVGLDAKLSTETTARQSAEQQVERLQGEKIELQQQVESLQQQLNRPAVHDPRIAAILARHGKG